MNQRRKGGADNYEIPPSSVGYSIAYRVEGDSGEIQHENSEESPNVEEIINFKEYVEECSRRGSVELFEDSIQEWTKDGVFTKQEMLNLLIVGYTNKIQLLISIAETTKEQYEYIKAVLSSACEDGPDSEIKSIMIRANYYKRKRADIVNRLRTVTKDKEWSECMDELVGELMKSEDSEAE